MAANQNTALEYLGFRSVLFHQFNNKIYAYEL